MLSTHAPCTCTSRTRKAKRGNEEFAFAMTPRVGLEGGREVEILNPSLWFSLFTFHFQRKTHDIGIGGASTFIFIFQNGPERSFISNVSTRPSPASSPWPPHHLLQRSPRQSSRPIHGSLSHIPLSWFIFSLPFSNQQNPCNSR